MGHYGPKCGAVRIARCHRGAHGPMRDKGVLSRTARSAPPDVQMTTSRARPVSGSNILQPSPQDRALRPAHPDFSRASNVTQPLNPDPGMPKWMPNR